MVVYYYANSNKFGYFQREYNFLEDKIWLQITNAFKKSKKNQPKF